MRLRTAGLLAVALGAAARRGLDLVVAGLLAVVTVPLVLVALSWARVRDRRFMTTRTHLGRWMRPVELGEVELPGPLRHVPRLWAVIRGDMSLVGPAPVPEDVAAGLTAADLVRFQVRPGLASLYALRASANIAFDGQTATEAEQVHTSTVLGDLGILARSVPAAFTGARSLEPPEKLCILGVGIHNWSMDRAVSWIATRPPGRDPAMLAFVNPDCLNQAFKVKEYRAALESCDVVLPDGIGIHYACRLLGTVLAANVNGTDLFPRLCDALQEAGQSLFLLGARPGVTDALVESMTRRWPQLRVAGHRHGFFARGGDEEQAVIDEVNASGAAVLLVAFGVPFQELWIDRHRAELKVRLAMGVGGLFDFYSGRVPRAPQWLRELGLEWTWRLLQEPRRMWRRYVIGNPLFLWRVWRFRESWPSRPDMARSGRSSAWAR